MVHFHADSWGQQACAACEQISQRSAKCDAKVPTLIRAHKWPTLTSKSKTSEQGPHKADLSTLQEDAHTDGTNDLLNLRRWSTNESWSTLIQWLPGKDSMIHHSIIQWLKDSMIVGQWFRNQIMNRDPWSDDNLAMMIQSLISGD